MTVILVTLAVIGICAIVPGMILQTAIGVMIFLGAGFALQIYKAYMARRKS